MINYTKLHIIMIQVATYRKGTSIISMWLLNTIYNYNYQYHTIITAQHFGRSAIAENHMMIK